MSRPTARKYLDELQVPNELQAKHTWRTREDCLVAIWPQAVVMLEEAPDLEAKALFEYLWERSPWAVQEKHLRTFQRRVKLWRLQYGPDQEVFFPQDWEAGRAMQLERSTGIDFPINPERVAPLLRRPGAPTKTRARIYDRDGVLLVDSRNLFGRGDVLRFDLPAPDAEKPGLIERALVAIRIWLGRGDLPLYRELGASQRQGVPGSRSRP